MTADRPRRLRCAIYTRKVDSVVTYKVDRLTRSLADFAKIVEVFDRRGVSFVSVTQQFNTTTSMGRLTLNMLLSFAQFERGVIGERIRDKIAASKRNGMWMGGFVPLGYDAKDRSLVINQPEAGTFRAIFRRYLGHGNLRRVKAEADRLKLKSKLRPSEDGRMRGGRPLSRGYIYKLLGNPIYFGRIAHKGEVYEGLHEAIIDAETWEAVQSKLADNAHDRRSGSGAAEPSLLAGLLHDERGNRLSPSHAVKNGARYRYYVSQAVLQHRDDDAGSIVRIPAREIEELVVARIAAFLKDAGQVIDDLTGSLAPRDQECLIAAAGIQAERWPRMAASERRVFILHVVAGVTVGEEEILIELRRTALRHALLDETSSVDTATAPGFQAGMSVNLDVLTLRVPTRLKLCSGEMRLVIPPGQRQELQPRPNAALIKALTRAHRWKERLFTGAAPSASAIAKEEGVTERYVSRIMRLAFLAPDIVTATATSIL
ncbi:MAG: recombinase family protein, partial [Kiloniellales bacterium]